MNLQNHKYNLKCCNRATGDDIRSLILSMHPEWVVIHVSICIMVSLFFFHLKNNFIKNAQNWSECWTQMWNTCCHSAKSTVYNQYHRSREWLIRSTGAYNERWRKEGCQQTGGEDTIETESGLIWFHASVDKWYQSRRVAFAAKNPDKYHGQTTNLPLWRPWETQSIAALCFTHSNHHRHKFGFFSSANSSWATLKKTPTVVVNTSLSSKTPGRKKKKTSSDWLQSRVRGLFKKKKSQEHSLHFKQNCLCFWSSKRERKPRAPNLSNPNTCPPHWGIITP